MTTKDQLPPLPQPDGQMTVTFGVDEKRKVPVFFGDRLTAYALAAIAQQAQEPVGVLKSDPYDGHVFEPANPEFWPFDVPLYTSPQPKPIAFSGADESPPVFGRRWRLADDGFGLQRDDADGNYVHIDDAISVLHQALATPQPQTAPTCGQDCHCLVQCGDFYAHSGEAKPEPQVPAPVDEREALRVLLAAVDTEMSDQWLCNSYHPSLLTAVEQARAALQSPAPQATKGGE